MQKKKESFLLHLPAWPLEEYHKMHYYLYTLTKYSIIVASAPPMDPVIVSILGILDTTSGTGYFLKKKKRAENPDEHVQISYRASMFAYTVRQAAAPINYPLGGAL
jgi:hypothetical protein